MSIIISDWSGYNILNHFLWGLRTIKIKRFDDKFVNGFIAGIIAFLLTTPIGFAAVYFNFAELGLSDFAGMLTLGNVPEGLAESIFAAVVDLMVSGALGIIFAFLVPHIGSRYLWFKGWFLLGAFWYIYSPVIAVSMLNNGIDINVQTHVINGMIAGLFGIVLAQAYYWLHRDIQGKNNTVEPTWPPGKALKITKVMADSVKLEWPAAINNNKDIQYKVLLNNVSVGETTDTAFIVSNLEPGTSYIFSVVAEDEAGNSAAFPPKKAKTRRAKK